MEYKPKSNSESDVKTCAVVQGNIRRGTSEILSHLSDHFDIVILSTWADEPEDRIPVGCWNVVLSDKPRVCGFTHRNYQRLSTSAGLKHAEILGATHVLKWRTDFLPTKIDVAQLLKWSRYEVAAGFSSRLVTCAFRNLTVTPDWCSTIPDLFSFSDIRVMKLLWGDQEFDYSREMNVPESMIKDLGVPWFDRSNLEMLYCAEAELYAIFRSRLENQLGRSLNHHMILKKYMRLIDHKKLGICWIASDGGFRSISQALQHPWWTEKTWESGEPVISELGYPEFGLVKYFRRKYLTPQVIKNELILQSKWYANYYNMKQ